MPDSDPAEHPIYHSPVMDGWIRHILTLLIPAALLIMMAAGGCSSSGSESSLDSRSADARVRAIITLAGESETPPDEESLGRLIEALDSDDPAVRFMTIHTLERWTGHTMDYRSADPPWRRAEAVEQWARAFQDGTLIEESVSGEMNDVHGSSPEFGEGH